MIMLLRDLAKYIALALVITITMLISHPLEAQNKITGRVVKAPGDPLSSANVLLMRAKDSSLVKGAVADTNGHYMFENFNTGIYLLSVSFTGFEKFFSVPMSLSDGDHVLQMGDITLTKLSTDLQSVNVIAKKQLFEQKIDRMVINVSTSITYAGGSVLEVLERSPGVLVNQQNNTISMNGKEGVVVMINNKINRMPLNVVVGMLAGMSANNIERIELITSPPAGMDSEGNAGYINIVLKSTSETGSNGSYALSGGFSRGESTQASINFNHRKKSLNIYGDISYSRTRSEQNWDVYNKILHQGSTKETFLTVYRPNLQSVVTGKIGADYTISNKTIVGFILSSYVNSLARHWRNKSELASDQVIDTVISIKTDDINKWKNISGNINMQHTLGNDGKLTINANYDYYYASNPAAYHNKYYDGKSNFLYNQYLESDKTTPIKIWVAAIDYAGKIFSKIDMETGLKGTFSTFVNKTSMRRLMQSGWQKDDLFSSVFNLNENILAGYVSISTSLGDATTIKAGVRYENTFTDLDAETKANVVHRKYGNFFPSLYVNRTFNKQHSIGFSYGRRTTRPSFQNLAPVTIFVDPYSYFYGNPALQASNSNSYSGAYTYRRKILSLSYSKETRPITNYLPKTDAATNIRSYAAENQKDLKTLTAAVTIPIVFFNWWTSQLNLSAVHQVMNVYIKESVNEIRQRYLTANFSQTFVLDKNYSIETSGSFNSGGFFGIFVMKPYGSLNAGIQKTMPKQHASLRFNAINILNSMAQRISIDLPERNLVSRFYMYTPYPGYRLTYTRNFGNDKVKQFRKRVTGAEDIKKRVE